MKKIVDTFSPPENVVDKKGYIDLEKWSGRPTNSIPLSVRDPNEAMLHVSSLSFLINDSTCDPRSGGIAGNENIAPLYGASTEHYRRNITKKRDYIKWLDDIPVTHISSATNDAYLYKQEVKEQRLKNLGIDNNHRLS